MQSFCRVLKGTPLLNSPLNVQEYLEKWVGVGVQAECKQPIGPGQGVGAGGGADWGWLLPPAPVSGHSKDSVNTAP